MILFKDIKSDQIWVIAAKGAFSSLSNATDELDLSSWENLTCFRNEEDLKTKCSTLQIEVIVAEDRIDTSAVSLGPEWDQNMKMLVDVDALLQQQEIDGVDLACLLKEDTFQQLALVCKTSNQISRLRSFISRHKQQRVVIHLEDLHGASAILKKLQRDTRRREERNRLMSQLRDAHTANRRAYEFQRSHPSDRLRQVKETNRSIDRALAILADLERSEYTADILDRKSNRARRADLLLRQDAAVHSLTLDLSHRYAYRSTCDICCGEDQIMSVVLKQLDGVDDNTRNFFLNFPLVASQAERNANMISSQIICFQCAALMPQRSIYKEQLSAVLPTVGYTEPNKPYINHQLTMAITNGLATGAAGIVQMFMTILDHTLRTKAWCSRSTDAEPTKRANVLDWMLQNLLQNCIVREGFTDEGSPLVKYPVALQWTIKDYKANQLDSWIIQYPLVGFNQVVRWYQILQLPNEALKISSSQSLSTLPFLHSKAGNWTHSFLKLIYKGFNATNVPRDLGLKSILKDDRFWAQLKETLGACADVDQLLSLVPKRERDDIRIRLQQIVFWLVYKQKTHATPKTVFQNLYSDEKLAYTLLNPAMEYIPNDVTLDIKLTSIFHQGDAVEEIHKQASDFVSPFGTSVLRCTKAGCGVLFYDPSDTSTLDPLAVRKRRAKHLNQVFGPIQGSETGLPEFVQAPKPPTSTHYNLHSSITKTWSQLNRTAPNKTTQYQIKEDIMNGKTKTINKFVTAVREHICATSRRGNIYQDGLEDKIRQVLPSFFEALRIASQKLELEDTSGLTYEHDWKKNSIAEKIEYELSLSQFDVERERKGFASDA
ncbi:MAG: hypothetical protein Q9167_004719 [Letrouitia subvulpina]